MKQSRASSTSAGFGLAAVLALTLAVPATAETSDQDAPLQGEHVEPGTHQDNAPVVEPGDYYTGSFGPETLYYRVARTMEESTLHVGLTTYDQEGQATDDAEIALGTFDGSSCDSDRLGWESGSAGNLLRGAQIRATAPRDPEHHSAVPECGSSQELLLTVETLGDELTGEDFELVIAEEPDPVNGDELRTSFEDDADHWGPDGLTWQELQRDRDADNPIDPGGSLHSAPQVEPGTTYDAALEPGGIHVYRISADWNEQIQAEVFFPEPDSQLSEHLGRWSEAEVSIISPYRGATTPSGNRAPNEQNTSNRVDDTAATTLRAQSYPVTWTGRFAGNQVGGNARHATVAGDYYLVVTMDPAEEGADEEETSFEVPYRLTAGVHPAFDETAPEYSQPAVTPAGSSDADTGDEQSDTVATPDEQTSGISAGQGLAIGLGLLGLLLIAGGGLFLARVMRQQRP
ncbi:hypothetical protein [Nesterenkonia muleiensis]|uniref:hypothetical protein n=1 Tax=Nesterenkonia muleiensis TaxID=2282648 RepID=UPI000E744722|nr:hypothetical protein [Nesterenkonia muleiensis]